MGGSPEHGSLLAYWRVLREHSNFRLLWVGGWANVAAGGRRRRRAGEARPPAWEAPPPNAHTICRCNLALDP